MNNFNQYQLAAMAGVISGVPLSKLGKDAGMHFHRAMSKLRFGISNFPASPVEGDADGYSLAWFKSHPAEAAELIARHERACDAASEIYVAIRCGIDGR